MHVTDLVSSQESLCFLVSQVPMDHGWPGCCGPARLLSSLMMMMMMIEFMMMMIDDRMIL